MLAELFAGRRQGAEGLDPHPFRVLGAASPLGRAVILEAVGWGMHQNMCGVGFAFLPTKILCHPIPACQPGCYGAPCALPKAQNWSWTPVPHLGPLNLQGNVAG